MKNIIVSITVIVDVLIYSTVNLAFYIFNFPNHTMEELKIMGGIILFSQILGIVTLFGSEKVAKNVFFISIGTEIILMLIGFITIPTFMSIIFFIGAFIITGIVIGANILKLF